MCNQFVCRRRDVVHLACTTIPGSGVARQINNAATLPAYSPSWKCVDGPDGPYTQGLMHILNVYVCSVIRTAALDIDPSGCGCNIFFSIFFFFKLLPLSSSNFPRQHETQTGWLVGGGEQPHLLCCHRGTRYCNTQKGFPRFSLS